MKYKFDGKNHGENSWVDTMSGIQMSADGSDTSFVFENNALVLTKESKYFSFPTEHGSYGTFEVLVRIDESFTPGNETLWYRASCIFGTELGGTHKDWGMVIDKNGYFALGYSTDSIASTSVRANDGNWHTITAVVQTSGFRFFVDGVLAKTVNYTMSGDNITDFGVGWNNMSSFTSVTGSIGTIKVWSKALTDDEVKMSYNNSLTWLGTLKVKYLIREGTVLYTIDNEELVPLTNNSVSAETFVTHGSDNIPKWSVISTLADPEILRWCEVANADLPSMTATVSAMPFPQTLRTPEYSINYGFISGINNVAVTATEGCEFAVSFDGGESWCIWTGTEWLALDVESSGMSATEVNDITAEQWALGVTNETYCFQVTMPNETESFASIIVQYLT